MASQGACGYFVGEKPGLRPESLSSLPEAVRLFFRAGGRSSLSFGAVSGSARETSASAMENSATAINGGASGARALMMPPIAGPAYDSCLKHNRAVRPWLHSYITQIRFNSLNIASLVHQIRFNLLIIYQFRFNPLNPQP